MTRTHHESRPTLAACAVLLLVPAIALGCSDGSQSDASPAASAMPSSPEVPATVPSDSSPATPGASGLPGAVDSSAANNGAGAGTPSAPSAPVTDPTAAGSSGSAGAASPPAGGTSPPADTAGPAVPPGGMTGGPAEPPPASTVPDDSMVDGMPDDMMPDDSMVDGMPDDSMVDGMPDDMMPDDSMVDTGPVFHIFLMMGQSNMVGVAGLQESDRNTDERLQVLGGCNKPPMQWNLADPPLHDCYMNPVGPGDWFGKVLLEKLPEGHTIGLVPTAVSGESINTFISGGSHHQDILDKIEFAKNTPNARFEGIIFHQGETDTGADWWVERVVQLYDEVKAAMGIDYDIPFIAGELPADPGNCCASHNTLVNQLPNALPMGYVVSQEGTQRFDQYHFDHDSVVLMGTRYGETMLEALGW